MKNIFKKLAEKFGRGVASVISLLLLFCIVVTAGLQIFAFWLNSSKGEAWLAGQITALMEATPYQITLDRFELSGFLGLGAHRITLADSKGVFLTLDGVGIDIDLLPLAMKRAWLNIDAATATLHRLPETAGEEDTGGNDEIFTLPARPDVFFNAVTLDVNIETLAFEDEIIEGGLSSAVHAKQDFTFREKNIEWVGRIDIRDTKGAAGAYLPEKISHIMQAPWGGSDMTIPYFELERDDAYRVKAEGLYHPAGNNVGLDIDAEIDQAFHPEITDNIKITAHIDGTPDAYQGGIKGTGEIRSQPLSLSATIDGSPQKITVGGITGETIGTVLEGEIALLPQNGYKAEGYLKAVFETLALVNALTPETQISGHGSTTLNLGIENGVQVFSGSGHFENIVLNDVRLNNLDWQARPQGGNGIVDILFSLDGFDKSAFEISGGIAADMQDKTADINGFSLKTEGGEIKASGIVSGDALNARITYERINPNSLPFITLPRVPLFLQEGRIDITGTAAEPLVTVSSNIVPRMRRARDILLSLDGKYESGTVGIDAVLSKGGQSALNAAASFPARISFLPFEMVFAADAPLGGTVAGDVDMAEILDPVLGEGHELSGHLLVDNRISGQLGAPVLDGQVRLMDGRYVNEAQGVILQDINGQMQMAGKQVTITRLTATDGGAGRVNVTGGIDLSRGFPPVVDLDIKADTMRFLNGSDVRADVDAALEVTTGEGIYTVSGIVTPNEFLYTLPDRFDTSIPELNIVTDEEKQSDPLFEIIRLDMVFDAAQRIIIRGWGLDVQLGGKLEIAGTAATPDVRGSLSVVRGNYEEFGRRFELAESSLRFQGSIPPSPYLDITAAAEIENYTTYVYIRGPATDPDLSFGSTPAMPEDEVLAYILFGENINQISPFQALQLANTLRRFSGGGSGLDPIAELQQATGLDDLRIEGGTGEGVSVGAGKYLSDDVYLEVKQGAEEGSGGARVEVELTPSITVESEVSSRGETGGGIFWEWDY